MSDFDYNGYGLFESLASDQQEERRAQRKALVTASARVENTLGSWLKAASSGPEFDERYSLVQQEFISTIREAAEEFGVPHAPVANTIFSHYRTAAYKLADKDEDEEDEKSLKEAPEPVESEKDEEDDDDDMSDWHSESSVKTAGHCKECAGKGCCPADCDCTDCSCCGGKQSSFLAEADTRTADGGEKGQCSECENEGFLKGGVCGPCRGKKLEERESKDKEHWIQDAVKKPGDLHRKLHVPEGEKIPESEIEHAEETGDKDLKEKAQFAENVRKGHIRWAAKESFYPGGYGNSDQELAYLDSEQPINYDDGSMEGDHLSGRHYESGPVPGCPWCENPGPAWHSQEAERYDPHGDYDPHEGRVAAEGADADDSYEKPDQSLGEGSEAEGNSGLSDKASPVIDKGEARKDGDTGWSLESVDPPSKKHPTVHMDPTVVLPRENIKTTVKDQVKGIGESVTESQELPTSTNFDDAGFAGPNQEQAPHTDQWGNDGQVEPVTNTALAKQRWAAAFPLDPNAPSGRDPRAPRVDPAAPPRPEDCPNCRGAGCEWCHGIGAATLERDLPPGIRAQDATPGGVTFPAEWVQ
jgi:hypothetical protein